MNKACTERVRKREFDMHKQRIKDIKSQVDTTRPHVCQLDHLRNNMKREQLLEDRYYEIDRDNRILLQKMSDIMKSPTYSSERAKSGPPSLNRDSRKTELMRITHENHAILKRIQSTQPVYNHVSWEQDYRRSATYLKNTCEYPVVLKRKTRRTGSLAPLSQTDKSDMFGSSRMGATDHSGVVATGSEMGEELRYVLKEGKRLGQKYYLVEMATDGRTLAISAYDGDSQKTLELVVNERNHRRLYRDCNGDYNLIGEKLRVEGDQLLLPMDAASPAGASTGASASAGAATMGMDAAGATG